MMDSKVKKMICVMNEFEFIPVLVTSTDIFWEKLKKLMEIREFINRLRNVKS